MARKSKGPMTSLSERRAEGGFATSTDPTTATLDEQIRSAIEERVACKIDFTTYRARNGDQERAVHVLWDNRHIITMKEPYGDKPARIEVATVVDDHALSLKKAKGAAFFSLNRSGFDRSEIKTMNSRFTDAADMWAGCFDKGFGDQIRAKAQFLRMIGAQSEESLFQREQAKAEKVAMARTRDEAVSRYTETPGYGLF